MQYPDKIGVLAGGGALPRALISACQAKGIDVFVVAFTGQTDANTVHGLDHVWVSLGQAGAIIKALHSRSIADLVLIGSIKRPSFSSLKTDLKGAKILAQLAMKSGDSDLLSALKAILQGEGFTLHGMQSFVDNALSPKGIIGRVHPSKDDYNDIKNGVAAALDLGRNDVGQAVIVRGETVMMEDVQGTDVLVQKWNRAGGVLVKLCKPQQDQDLDLPTIGPDTVRHAHAAGLRGVAVHAGHSFIVALDAVRELADGLGVFVMGVSPEDYT